MTIDLYLDLIPKIAGTAFVLLVDIDCRSSLIATKERICKYKKRARRSSFSGMKCDMSNPESQRKDQRLRGDKVKKLTTTLTRQFNPGALFKLEGSAKLCKPINLCIERSTGRWCAWSLTSLRTILRQDPGTSYHGVELEVGTRLRQVAGPTGISEVQNGVYHVQTQM